MADTPCDRCTAEVTPAVLFCTREQMNLCNICSLDCIEVETNHAHVDVVTDPLVDADQQDQDVAREYFAANEVAFEGVFSRRDRRALALVRFWMKRPDRPQRKSDSKQKQAAKSMPRDPVTESFIRKDPPNDGGAGAGAAACC